MPNQNVRCSGSAVLLMLNFHQYIKMIYKLKCDLIIWLCESDLCDFMCIINNDICN